MLTDDPRTDILNLLKRKDCPVDDLSPQLGISPTATRQHLSILERDGLIKRTIIKEKIGRPKVFYSLTEKAEEKFPKFYSQFLKWIINDILEHDGPEKVRAMAERIGTEQGLLVKERLGSKMDVESLVDLFSKSGAFAEQERVDGQIIIKEYNCLLSDIALEFGEVVCETCLNVIGTSLNLSVELRSCIVRGDKCCSFAIGVKQPGEGV